MRLIVLKVILTVVAVAIAVLIMWLPSLSSPQAKPGGLIYILVLAVFAGIRAIWKYKPPMQKKDDEIDKHILDKKE